MIWFLTIGLVKENIKEIFPIWQFLQLCQSVMLKHNTNTNNCRSFQIRYAAQFSYDFPPGQSVSVRSFLIAATTWYPGFFLLSLVISFACDIGQWVTIWIWVSSEISPFSGFVNISRPATSCWRDPTRLKQLSMVAFLCFQFGLYHVVAPLSFLRSTVKTRV